jgi:hypothetical protein
MVSRLATDLHIIRVYLDMAFRRWYCWDWV